MEEAAIISAVWTPIGATGVMRMATLPHEMKRRNARYGLEPICDGGGLAIAAVLERRRLSLSSISKLRSG